VIEITTHQPPIAGWLQGQGHEFHQPYVAIAAVVDGSIGGAAVYNSYTGANIDLSVVVEDRRAVNRRSLATMFAYPFTQLGCRRVTCRTRARSRQTRRLIERMGFIVEGRQHRYYWDDDAVLYRMYASECKWIEDQNGLTLSAARA
jgi:hypothetical protein